METDEIDKIVENIVEKFEFNRGLRGVLNEGVFKNNFIKLPEMSMWQYGNLLSLNSHNAAVEILDRVRQVALANPSYSLNEVLDIIETIEKVLSKKAGDIHCELI